MAQNVFAMALKMRNHAVTQTRNLGKEVERTGNKARKMGTKFGMAVKSTRSSIGGLMGSFISLKAIIIATFAYRAIQRFGKFLGSLTKMMDDQTKAVMLLGQNLASFGNYTKSTLSELEKLAAVLQKLQGVGDEEIMINMALLASYGATADEIRKLTPLLIDFAKAKNIDIKTSFDLAGKASVGYFGTLSRYGVILDATLSKEEKYAEFMKMLGVHTGTAAALTKTYEGKMILLGLTYGDMKEKMGSFIQNGILQSDMLDMLSGKVEAADTWFKKWRPTLIDLTDNVFTGITAGLDKMMSSFDNPAMIRFMVTLVNGLKTLKNIWGTTYGLIKAGLETASVLLESLVISAMRFWAWLSKDEELLALTQQMEAEHGKTAWARIEDIHNKRLAKALETDKAIAASWNTVVDVWTKGGVDRWVSKMEERNRMLKEHQDIQENVSRSVIANREKINEKLKETFKITEGMAKSFALASKVEQAQTKFLLEKSKGMTAEDVGGLSEMEKKIIGKQGVLKEFMGKMFEDFTKRALGVNGKESGSQKVEVEIDLSESAKKVLQVGTVSHVNKRIERTMAS
ncbi:MAG: hypothetical protein FVQ80_11490 [Planctomycetes bacterium]|nr:hypothetical protein [Planctomycetota bacterium]